MIARLKPHLAATDLHALFPAMVWQFQLKEETSGPIQAAVTRVLEEGRRRLPPLARGQGWQSGYGLHKRTELRALVEIIELAGHGVLTFLKVGAAEFQVTGCWATVLAPGAAHPVHHHPNNFLSGVYYVRTPAGADTIYFHDPRPQAGVIRPPVTELTRENTDLAVIQVRPGMLLLFPAWLPHSVPENASAEERVSLSFNIMFPRYAEELSRPLWGEE
ncbi:MAG: hypothetical protein KatS3mg123_2441 [Burkholderiales bacterium]|nr:MAG: hypothetical protein KatS3mg123_2441 [Burkholderiales bacterium]